MSKFIAMEKDSFLTYLAQIEKIKENPKAFIDADQMQASQDLYQVRNRQAIIPISGSLSRDGVISYWFFSVQDNARSYNAIIEATQKADSDPEVDTIVYEINSPGGYVDGVDEAGAAIANAKKPTMAKVGGMAASAAYWLASQADSIEATSRTARFGSIGVIVQMYDYREYFESMGIKEFIITSTDAPNKYSDPSTPEGMKSIVSELDDLHSVFASRVAEGRGVSLETINKDFGQGGVLIAEKALQAGMIDTINSYKSKSDDNFKGEKKMEEITKEMLESAKKEAFEAGKKEAIEQASKHLAFIDKANNEKVVENIKSGVAYVDCIEEYAEEAAKKKYAAERTEDLQPEGLNPVDHAEELEESAKKETEEARLIREENETIDRMYFDK